MILPCEAGEGATRSEVEGAFSQNATVVPNFVTIRPYSLP